MSVLVFGETGQVATELRRIMPDAIFLSRNEADLEQPESCAAHVHRIAPRGVINAAAYTAVDAAEENEDIAVRVNAEAPRAIAESCANLQIPMVHISTDYVFPGDGIAPWRPCDAPGPLSVYGKSKLAGEYAVGQAEGVHGILRTSWVFSAHGSNFLKTMLRLSEERDAVSVVDDQVGGPTPAAAIAEACCRMLGGLSVDPSKSGVYHLSGAPNVSWKNFAREIFDAAGRSVMVTGLPTSAYPTSATRPLNSRLDCTTTYAAFGISRPNWKEAVRKIVERLI